MVLNRQEGILTDQYFQSQITGMRLSGNGKGENITAMRAMELTGTNKTTSYKYRNYIGF